MRLGTRAANALRLCTHRCHPGQASIASASRGPVITHVGWLASPFETQASSAPQGEEEARCEGSHTAKMKLIVYIRAIRV